MPSFARQIARIEAGVVPPVLEVGNLSASRDFLPVQDVVQAYIKIFAQAENIISGTIFNVASGQPRTIASVLNDLILLARVSLTIRQAENRMRASEIPVAAGNANRLTAAIDWHPKNNWSATLEAILDEAREIVTQSQLI